MAAVCILSAWLDTVAGRAMGINWSWILSQYGSRTNVRRSMLQATTFDPARDHVANAQLRLSLSATDEFRANHSWGWS